MKPLKNAIRKVVSGAGIKPRSPVKPITGGMAGGVRSVVSKPTMPTRLTSKPAMPGRAAAAPKAIAKAKQMKKK
jgi:hypothetical protein